MTFDTGVRIGRYEIGRKLGQGGFGILYAARDAELGRDIAIKFLRPEHAFRPQLVQRFLQEARAAARISHPGIVTVYESGQVSGTNTRADGTVYIAMELLAGDTLANRLKQSGRLPYRMAIGFCRQMATALAAAHQAGIVHRDLKPQNVFLVPDPAVLGGERIKVLDFGIAKLVDDMGSALNTHSMLMLGTPMYMSPEQCRSSARVDTRSDIYALGCILFEMVCGQTPFEGDSGELIAKHQLVPPPTARSINPELPIVLEQLIAAMLAKNPDERPQTMSLVLDVLSEFDDRSVEPPTMTEHRALIADVQSSLAPPPATLAPPTVEETPLSKARSRLRRLSGRTRIAIGAAAAAVFGIVLGFCSTRSRVESPAVAQEVVAEPEPSLRVESVAPVIADAAVVAPAPAEDPKDVKLACLQAQLEKRWVDLHNCGQRLEPLAPGEGASLVAIAREELGNELALDRLQDAIAKQDLAAAKQELDSIEPTSVFHTIAQTIYAGAQPNAPPKPVKTATKTKSKCDFDQRLDLGLADVRKKRHASALTHFEAALQCQHDQYVEKLAFVAACNSRNTAKARTHHAKLTPTQRDEVDVMCERNKIKLASAAPATCDAVALKDEGLQNINIGQHAAALSRFEASLRCKRDDYVLQLAFMESCASANSPKAKVYYKLLSPVQREKFAQICIRQRVQYE